MDKKMIKTKQKHAKELRKVALKHLRANSKARGFKVKSVVLYKIYKGFFFNAVVNISYNNSQYRLNPSTSIRVKPYSLDDLYWDIFDISSNKNEPVSLRAIGAFVAPDIAFDNISVIIESDDMLEESCEKFLQLFDDVINKFLNEINDISAFYEFVKSKVTYERETLLYILLEIHLGNYSYALELLNIAIDSGRSGGFAAGNKNIFEFAKEYCEARI